jgi:hypothetical protein
MKITMKPGELMDVTCHGADGYITLVCEGNLIRVVVEGSLRDFPVHAEELATPTRKPIHGDYQLLEAWVENKLWNEEVIRDTLLRISSGARRYYKMFVLFVVAEGCFQVQRDTKEFEFLKQALEASRDCPYWEEK